MTKKVVLTYRLPEKHKSAIHEKLFGRPVPAGQGKRSGGLLNRHVARWDHGEMWVRTGELGHVKSILHANNVAFTEGPRPRKRSSILRARRRRKAGYASWYGEHLRYLKQLKAISRDHIDAGIPGAKSEYNSIKRSIEATEEILARLRPPNELKEWYLRLCRGRICAYVRADRRAQPNARRLNIVEKALRSILKKGIVSRQELDSAARTVSEEANDRRKAKRLLRLARRLRLRGTRTEASLKLLKLD